ncbi:g11005 [Coccomyxa viridis]|uniref:G11005 protein n=1 Tax=Coccomyxa viridis TaxID=1274662 RepID=A0ABP1G9I6_9CHLO
MSIQPYVGPIGSNNGAVVALNTAQEITPEEYERRQKEAEELEKKLKFISEKVPNRICQVMGSNAGAGSGEFHMYRMARRREMVRQERMEQEAKEEELDVEYETRKTQAQKDLEERTAKRRAKRLKRKAKKRKAGPGMTEAERGAAGSGDEDSDEEGIGQAALD